MTCYFRHLNHIFEKAEIQVTPQNKKQLDKLIYCIVRTNYKDCPATWSEIKKQIANNENEFVAKLKSEWEKQNQ